MQGTLRKAQHAGTWYSSQKDQLREELKSYLSKATSNLISNLRALIVPHAGLRWSGPTAAWGYKTIDNSKYKRVFILGPSHKAYIEGCGLTQSNYLETPLGNLKVDTEIINSLKNQKGFTFLDMDIDENEHSIEMQFAYLKYIFKDENTTFIPIMVGYITPETESYYGKVFSEYYKDEENLFIISSDFCHWGKRFKYVYREENKEIWESIQNLDRSGMHAICSNDPDKFRQYLEQTSNTICGRKPILVFLSILKSCKEIESTTEFIKYDQSSKVEEENESSVSYAVGINFIDN